MIIKWGPFHTLFLSVIPLLGTANRQTPELPAVVSSGLVAYRTGGAKAALQIWLKGSSIGRDPRSLTRLEEDLDQLGQELGSFQGYDTFRVISLTPHVSRTYVILLFARGPIYAYFDCYSTAAGWIVTAFQYNGKPEAILPSSLLAH